MIDGTLIPIDRVAADRPFYSGKHRRHGMNLQVISAPDGEILWVSGPLPGAVHDLTAARIWGILRELAASGLIVLAEKGYAGAGEHVRIPYRGRGKPASQKDANRAHAQLRSPGERANAQLKTWRILRKLRCCPWRAGQLAKAIHVLQAREIAGGAALRKIADGAGGTGRHQDAGRTRPARTRPRQHGRCGYGYVPVGDLSDLAGVRLEPHLVQNSEVEQRFAVHRVGSRRRRDSSSPRRGDPSAGRGRDSQIPR